MIRFLSILLVFFLTLSCVPGFGEAILSEGVQAVQDASTIDEQLEALSRLTMEDIAELEAELEVYRVTVEPAGELPEGCIPDVESAEASDGLPQTLQSAKFIVIRDQFSTDGSFKSRTLPGAFFARLGEENKARSLNEADAVLYITETFQKRGDYIGTAYNRLYTLYAAPLDGGSVYRIDSTGTTPPYSGIGVLTGEALGQSELWARFESSILNIPLTVEYPEGRAVFRLTEGGVCMTGLEGTFTRFEVPQEVEGRTVVGIEKIKSSDLRELILPEGLRWISGRNAIECQFLESIRFPSTLKRITGEDVFWYKPWSGHPLGTLDFNEGLEEIGEDALQGTLNIRSITLPSTLRTLGAGFLKYGLGCGWAALPEGLEKLPGQFLSESGYVQCVYLPGSITDFAGNALNADIRIYTPSGSPASQWAERRGFAWYPCESAEEMPKPEIEREGDFEYCVLDSEAKLLRYYGTDEEVHVPDTLGGAPVRAVRKDAFTSFAGNNFRNPVRILHLPETVTRVDTPCVYDGRYLEALYIPFPLENCTGPIVEKCPKCTVYTPADSAVREACEANGIPWSEWNPQSGA